MCLCLTIVIDLRNFELAHLKTKKETFWPLGTMYYCTTRGYEDTQSWIVHCHIVFEMLRDFNLLPRSCILTLWKIGLGSPWLRESMVSTSPVCSLKRSQESPISVIGNCRIMYRERWGVDRWGNNCSPLSNGSTVKVMARLTFYSDFVSGWWVMQGRCTLRQTGQSDVLCTRQVWLLLVLLDP